MQVTQVSFDGVLRPKMFLKCTEGELTTYVRSCPFLLRLRLLMARRRLKTIKRKLDKFF
jgi:hypothetical protein